MSRSSTPWHEAAGPEVAAVLERMDSADRAKLIGLGTTMLTDDLEQIDKDIDVGLKMIPRLLRGPVKKILGV